MPRKKTIIIADKQFDSQKDAIKFYKDILNNYNVGDEISDEDFELVYNLLKNHPRSTVKIGCGVEKIIVDRDDYNNRCFHIIRKDGGKENFSYLKCIRGEPNSFTNFSIACRKAVEDDIMAVKEKYFKENANSENKVRCQESEELISFNEAHVHHRQPNTFSVIVDRFIENNRIDIAAVGYEKEGTYGHKFKDKDLETRFREYHKKIAKLRIVKGKRNIVSSHQAKVQKQKKDIIIG